MLQICEIGIGTVYELPKMNYFEREHYPQGRNEHFLNTKPYTK